MKSKKLFIVTILLAVVLIAGSLYSAIRLKNVADNIDILKKELAEYQESITEKDEEIKTLIVDVLDRNSHVDALTVELSEKSSQVDKLTADVKSKTKEIDGLIADAAVKATEIDSLKADLDAKTAEYEALTADVSEKNNLSETLETDAVNMKSQIDSLTAALEEAKLEERTDIGPKTIEPIIPVLSGDGWAITHEYAYSSGSNYTTGIVIHHMKQRDQSFEVAFNYYNSNNELIGGQTNYIIVASSNVDYYVRAIIDTPYDYVTYSVKLKDQDSMLSPSNLLDISTLIVDKKAIITATNHSKHTLTLTYYNVLFLDENGDIVSTHFGFLDDIEPGQSVVTEVKPLGSNAFTDVVVYPQPFLPSFMVE